MVEFALVAPLFFTVLFGGIELGLMFRSYLALESTTRGTARVASIERDSDTSDAVILDRIATLAGPLQGDVTRVVIFKADSLDAEVPPNCLVASFSGLCNSYPVANGDVASVASGALQSGWIGADRNALDNIGIHIEFEYTYATGFFDTLSLSSTTVEVIELDL